MGQSTISQRDLRQHSKEIMDRLEGGETFTVTRDGHEIGELVPLRRRRTFVPGTEFFGVRGGVPIDVDRFRADLDAVVDPYVDDPYER